MDKKINLLKAEKTKAVQKKPLRRGITAAIFAFILVFAFVLAACAPAQRVRDCFDNPDGVIDLTLYSFDGTSEAVFGIPVLGHSFIALKNNGEQSVYVYGYEIPPLAEVTIGTWGQSAHFGIWFNIEAQYMNIGRYKGVVSVTQRIDGGGIDRLEQFMRKNDLWTADKNCSYFAASAWNVANGKNAVEIDGLYTPEKLREQISAFKSFKYDRTDFAAPLDAAYKNAKGKYIVCPLAD